MDEEDGRTGPLAATIGHSDATEDALPESLRLGPIYPIHTVILSESAQREVEGSAVAFPPRPEPASAFRPAFICTHKEKNHENVPGK
jgi:hypothetical protein